MKPRVIVIALIFLSTFSLSSPAFAQDDAPAPPAKKDIMTEAQDNVRKICTSIQPFMSRPQLMKDVKVDKSQELNAYADNKGHVVFFMGMVNFVQSEDELALICAHELTHLSGQHIKRSMGTGLLATVAAIAIGGDAGNIVGGAIQSKQERKHEREADATGLYYMWQAGFDPRIGYGFWGDFGRLMGSGDNALAKYFNTHPVDKERTENMRVLLYRDCMDNPKLRYCDEILADPGLKASFDAFQTRK
jgi:predicted Zn-dependent protease